MSVTLRNKWLQYKITPSHSLTSQIKTIYGKLMETSNSEHFYQLFYSQLLYSPNFFTGLDNNLSVELLRKAADKFLAHYQKHVKSGKSNDEISAPILSSNEIDALEYLGGYVLHNLHNKRNNDALDILDCFKSEAVLDKPLINLQSRGGLTGITSHAKNMFLKAEHVFREFTARNNPQNINCKRMVDMLMYEVQVISCYTISTQLLENIDEELLLNVVESMFTLYLPFRSFSYVRELAAERKKEKQVLVKEKVLRKGLRTQCS